MLAAILVLLALNQVRLSQIDADPQSLANVLCARTDFPNVDGPAGWQVRAHRVDCTLLAKRSTISVYLHAASGFDDPTNLIARYAGAPPKLSWLDPKHLVLHIDDVADFDLLLAVAAGVHITASRGITTHQRLTP